MCMEVRENLPGEGKKEGKVPHHMRSCPYVCHLSLSQLHLPFLSPPPLSPQVLIALRCAAGRGRREWQRVHRVPPNKGTCNRRKICFIFFIWVVHTAPNHHAFYVWALSLRHKKQCEPQPTNISHFSMYYFIFIYYYCIYIFLLWII